MPSPARGSCWVCVSEMLLVVAIAIAGVGSQSAVASSKDALASVRRRQPRAVEFEVEVSIHGEYRYHYTARGGPSAEKLIAFFPSVTYPSVRLYPSGKPPRHRRSVADGHGRTAELAGQWAMEYFDPEGEDSCQASGGLVPNAVGEEPLFRASYTAHGYSLAAQTVPSTRPFLYTSTEIGGPCGTTDPWSEWVVRNGVANRGTNTFTAYVRVTQRTLEAVARGNPTLIAVTLSPSEGLASADCGSAPDLGVSCTQALEWTGAMRISRVRRH
jgi:hypothetical protein